MDQNTNNYDFSVKSEYNSMITFLALMTSVFAFTAILVGYLALPFAVGFYTALLFFEKKNKICSILIPCIFFALNLLINGIFSLEGTAYVVISLIFYLCFTKNLKKSDTVIILSSTIFLMIILSFILLGIKETGSLKFSSVGNYYLGFYYSLKDSFVEIISSLTAKDDMGILYFVVNRAEAEEYFNYFTIMLFPFLAVVSLVISAVAIKIFGSNFRKYSVDDKIDKWLYYLSSPTAILYVICSVLEFFEMPDLISYTISAVSFVLMIPFLYIGTTVVFGILSHRRSKFFSFALIAACIVLNVSISIRILSYLGIYFNKLIRQAESKTTN